MPWSALPERLQSPAAWKGTDWDNSWQRWLIPLKGWFAFGPRAAEWWARWRPVPIDLFKINDGTPWHLEEIDDLVYTSRIQPHSRWHLLVQWPFSVSFHIYWKSGTDYIGSASMGISKMFFAYGPTHFDQDQIYWMPSFFVGGDWK